MGKAPTKTGDIFFVENRSAFGRFINWGQTILSSDGEARYTHSGIITDNEGTTLESLWQVSEHNFYDEYRGKQVLIVNPIAPLTLKKIAIDRLIKEDIGEAYPVHRFLFLLLPYLAKYTSKDGTVCSEFSAKYAYYLHLRHKYFHGTTPDKLVDEVRHWKDEYEIRYEGICYG